MKKPKTIIVMGIVGRDAVAGVTLQHFHYLEGLRKLGFYPLYFEATEYWPYDEELGKSDAGAVVKYIDSVMRPFGLGDRWAYRSAIDGTIFGMPEEDLRRAIEGSVALINVTGTTTIVLDDPWFDALRKIPLRLYVETDPVLNQLEIAMGRFHNLPNLESHTHHFTFGENFGNPDCKVPLGKFDYIPTRQPVVVDWWWTTDKAFPTKESDFRFTTISSWDQSGSKDISWKGITYNWNKSLEFMKFLELPARASATFELALNAPDEVHKMLRGHGWTTTDGYKMSRTLGSYQEYIKNSNAEFTVAKDQYYLPRSGWFSDRSACYLAAGNPVVMQDTGFGNILPTGAGLFAFKDGDDIAAAVDTILDNPVRAGRAAYEIAREYFDAETVVGQMLADAGYSE